MNASSEPTRINFGICATLLLLAFGTCQASAVGVFNVKDFGAAGNGSHNDQPALQAAINAAIAAGPESTVFLPSGQYMLDKKDTDAEQIAVFRSNRLSIVGESGVVLINPSPIRSFFNIWNNRELRLESLDLKRSVRTFSQVTIKSIDLQNDVIAQVNSGYDDLETRWIKRADQLLVFSDPSSGTWGDHSSACSYYAPKSKSVCWPPTIISRKMLASGVWRLRLNTPPQKDYIGKTAVLWNEKTKSYALNVSVTDGFVANNIKYYPSGSDGAFYAKYNSGKFIIKEMNLVKEESSPDLVFAVGGSYSMDNHFNLLVEGSSFTKVWDDGLNTGAHFNDILHPQASPTRSLDVSSANSSYVEGDTVAIWDWTPDRQFEETRRQLTKVDCDSLPGVCHLTLDKSATVDTRKTGSVATAYKLIDINAAGTLHVKDSSFQSFHASGIALKAQNAFIENSKFFDTVGPGIAAGTCLKAEEGPTISRLTISNNIFDNVSSSNIVLGTDRKEKVFGEKFVDSNNVKILSNTFLNYGQLHRGTTGNEDYPIYIRYTNVGVVAANRRQMSARVNRKASSTLVVDSANIVIEHDVLLTQPHH